MSNRHDCVYTNVSQTVESELRITSNFSPAIQGYDTKASGTFSSVLASADSKVIGSSADLHDIFNDLSLMRREGFHKCGSHEGSARSNHSTLSQISIDARALPINQLQHIPRVSRTTQPTASKDIPLAILERMAYDTAASTLSLRGMSSFSVTPLSLGLNPDRGVLGRSAHENRVRMSFSPERSNRMAAVSLAISRGAEPTLAVVSPALSLDLFSEISASKRSDLAVKTAPTTCLKHVISGNCTDGIDSPYLRKHNRHLSGNRFGSRFTESTLDRKPLLEPKKDGLNAVSSEDAHTGSEKSKKRQRLLDTHLIRPLVPELFDATKRNEPPCQILSQDQDNSEKVLDEEGEDCCNLQQALLREPKARSPSNFSEPKEVPSYDKLMPPDIRFHRCTFHPTTPTPAQCKDWFGTHQCACSERNSVMTAYALNNPKRSRGMRKVWATPEGASTGAVMSSLTHPKDTSSTHMEPFQTWSFPTLFKSISSPFQSPLDDPLGMNTNGDVLECFPIDGESLMMRKEARGLSLGFLNRSPRAKIQQECTCTDEQLGSFSSRLESKRNPSSRMHIDLAATGQRGDKEIQDANQQPWLWPNGNMQRQGQDTGLLIHGTKDNIEFLRTWELIYGAYMRNCATHLGSGKVINSYEDYSSFDSSRACQQCGFGAGNFHQKNFQRANSFDSHKNAFSHGIPTPSTSVSGALSRSAGYYSFGNRLSLHHPNYQKIGFIPQHLGSFTHSQTPSQSPSARAGKEKFYGHVKLEQQEKSRIIMDPAVIARIERRPLLLTTVLLRYIWVFLGKSRHAIGDASDEAEGCSEPLPSNSNDNAVLPCIPEGYTSTNQPPNTFPNNYCTDPTLRGNSNTNLSSSLTLPNDNMEKTIVSSTSTLNTLTPNYFPLGHACEVSNGNNNKLVNNDTGSKFSNHEIVESSSDANLKAISTPQPPPVGTTQDVLRFSNPPFQEQHRSPLTQFKRIVRHQHSIDNLEREVDNESNDLIVYVGTRLMGWLEVVALLGSGSFGQVFLCMDLRISSGRFVHPSAIGGEDFAYWSCSHEYLPLGYCDIPPAHFPLVAVKVVKSIPLFEQQSLLEAEMLVLIGVQTAKVDSLEAASSMSQTQSSALHPPPSDSRCTFIGKILAHGACYGHHCIVMERYGANLYEYIQSHQHNGLPMYQIRSIAKQLLSALTLLHENCHIIHADIKPENLLLTLDSCRGMYNNEYMRQNSAKLSGSVTPTATESPNTEQAIMDSLKKHNHGESQYFQEELVESDSENSFTSPNAANLKARFDNDQLPSRQSLVGNCVDTSTHSEPHTGQTLKRRSRTQSAERVHVGTTTLQQLQDLDHIPLQKQVSSDGIGKVVEPHVGSLQSPNSLGTSMQDFPSLNVPRLHIKLIDFSSSCYDAGPFYTYIQSRYYRAPEIIVNAGYGPPIDLWSTGCVLVELLLGMPLLPGCNDHHQLTLIEEMLGPLPLSLLECGDSTHLYYDKQNVEDTNSQEAHFGDGPTHRRTTTAETSQEWRKVKAGEHLDNPTDNTTYCYKLVSEDDFFTRNNLPIVEYKRYFTCKTLQELVRQCPLPLEEKCMSHGLHPCVRPGEASNILSDAKLSETVCSELMRQRFLLYDLLRQLLNPDPQMRPTAAHALSHPFLSSDFAYMQQFGLE